MKIWRKNTQKLSHGLIKCRKKTKNILTIFLKRGNHVHFEMD